MTNRNRYVTLPEDWDELTEADWQEALKIRQAIARGGGGLTVEDARIETARSMLRTRGVREQPRNTDWLGLTGAIARSLTWLWTTEGDAISLCYRSTRNLMPRIGSWLGPKSHGEDLTFGEFRMAFAILKSYEADSNERHLNVLAGLLYRPEATEQMKHEQQLLRQPYDWDTFEEKEERGRRMERWQVWGIYAWLAYFCEALTSSTFCIDGEEVSFAPLFSSGKGGDGDGSGGGGLQQICLTLAESHVFGTARAVDRTPLLTVMQKLLLDYQTLMRLKKKK